MSAADAPVLAGIHHLKLPVTDLARSLEWYSSRLGYQVQVEFVEQGTLPPAPRRQFVIILSGQLEIGLGDGSKHIFGPGDARLVEDTTGQGHTTKVHGNVPCMTATIPLQQQ